MSIRFLRLAGLSFAISAILLLGACHKKSAPPVPPAPAPAPAKPTATLTASPSDVVAGHSAQLSWSTQNATDVSIDALGSVAASGSRDITPSASTTYTLTAKGAGGSVQATARVTVTAPPPPPPVKAGPTDAELFASNVTDIYFNYDRFDIRQSDEKTLKTDADFLSAHPGFNILIAGHCDERGSEEYNMALGSSRANSVRDALVKFGIAPSRIKTISYGKEKPFCAEQNESCWQQNRRAHFSLDK
jgi:peptidoglycan-associated lipoprotein